MLDEMKMLKEENDSMQSKLNQCDSGYQDAIITKNELDSCRGELTDEQNSKQQIYQDLQNAKRNIKTLRDDKNVLQNKLNLEKTENDNLRHQFTTVEKSEKKLNKRLKSAQQSIHTLKDEKEVLQKQLNLLHLKIEQSRCQQLENIRDLAEYDLWHENFVNGEYVVAYEIDPGLHQTVQYMLPKVHL